MASWQSFALNLGLRYRVKRLIAETTDVAAIRAGAGAADEKALKVRDGWAVRALNAGGVTFEVAEAHGALREPPRVLLYLHGGGYFFCSPQTHRRLSIRLAEALEATSYSLDYRLAPEHRFPAAADDALAAYRYLQQQFPAARVVIAGDSAGGGLALSLALAIRDHGLPSPLALVLFSPWTDLAGTGGSLEANTHSDSMFTGASIRRVAHLYLGAADPCDPRASPLYGDLAGLPPMAIFASRSEVLLDDARRLHAKAQAAGVHADLTLEAGLPHVWPLFGALPEARATVKQAAAFVARLPAPVHPC